MLESESEKTAVAASLDERGPHERGRRTLTLTITQACNLSCSYCYKPFKTSQVMPLSGAVSALQKHLKPDSSHHEVLIEVAGGEPMSEFERVREVCEWTWARTWRVPYLFFATTNGTFVHGPVQDWFRRNRHRFWLGLSLDGTPPHAPSFALALKRCGAAARLLESVSGKLDPLEELELTEMLWRIRNAAAALGVVMVEG